MSDSLLEFHYLWDLVPNLRDLGFICVLKLSKFTARLSITFEHLRWKSCDTCMTLRSPLGIRTLCQRPWLSGFKDYIRLIRSSSVLWVSGDRWCWLAALKSRIRKSPQTQILSQRIHQSQRKEPDQSGELTRSRVKPRWFILYVDYTNLIDRASPLALLNSSEEDSRPDFGRFSESFL